MINKKIILSKIAALKGEEACRYVSRAIKNIGARINCAGDLDQAVDLLELLAVVAYKAPEKALEATASVLDDNSLINTQGRRSGQDLFRTSHDTLINKAFDVLLALRYLKPEEVMKSVLLYSRAQSESLRLGAERVATEMAKYDYGILTKTNLGYQPQRFILDKLLNIPQNDRIGFASLIKVVSKEILATSIIGHETTGPNTLTMYSSSVAPTESLRGIRMDALGLVADMCISSQKDAEKIGYLNVLRESIKEPMHGNYGENLLLMLEEELKWLLGVYRRVVFDDKGALAVGLGVVASMDEHLYWLSRTRHACGALLGRLREDIAANPVYALLDCYVGGGDEIAYGFGSDELMSRRGVRNDALIESVSSENSGVWASRFEMVATARDVVDDWKFTVFRDLLRNFAAKKPELAFKMLADSMKNGGSLRFFSSSILLGLRMSSNLDLWDRLVNQVEQDDMAEMRPLVADSLVRNPDGQELIRFRKEEADWLCAVKYEGDLRLEYSVLRAMLINSLDDPGRLTSAVVKLLKQSKFNQYHLPSLEASLMNKWLDLSSFAPKDLRGLKKVLVSVPSFDWHAQGIVLAIGKQDPSSMLEILLGRIKMGRGRKRFSLEDRYEPIPHHFHDGLAKALSAMPELVSRLIPWFEKAGERWSPMLADMGRLLGNVKTMASEVMDVLISTGQEKGLWQVLYMLKFQHNEPDLEVFIKIVGLTDNKKIWAECMAALSSAGGVYGEDGLARIFKARAEALKPFLGSENSRVKTFAEEAIKNLLDHAERERVEAEEERELRRIEFEG